MFKSDDGYSGTNFNRPAWIEVMNLVENDEVATIIVKDMSRLGREYLQVGQLTELVFPNYNVRFIAIQDNVDSLYGDNDFTPFKNLFNDFYAKDTSRKIRAVKKAKAERGERVGTRAPYGYQKLEDDPKKKIVPEEETAGIVKRIFNMCATGLGPSQIAKQLKTEQILTPTNYYYRQTGVALTSLDTTIALLGVHHGTGGTPGKAPKVGRTVGSVAGFADKRSAVHRQGKTVHRSHRGSRRKSCGYS